VKRDDKRRQHVLNAPMPKLPAVSFVVALAGLLSAGPVLAQTQGVSASDEDEKRAEDEKRKSEDERRKSADEKRKTEDEQKRLSDPSSHRTDKPVEGEEAEADKAVYFSGDLAFTRSDLGLLSDDLAFDKTGANGVMYGVSGGYRTKNLRLGLRWRVNDTTEFSLWSFAVSAGWALPMRPLTPILSAHLGYVFDQKIEPALIRSSLPPGNIIPPDVDVKGVVLGVDLNAAYWVTTAFRIGPFLGADLMFLHRAKASPAGSMFGPTPDFDVLPLYSESGTGFGLNLNGGIRGAFDIGLR
jgi:hypothetical protein